MTSKTVRLKSLKADLKKENEGDWQSATDLEGDIKWLVRSTNYQPFVDARADASRKLASKYDSQDNIPQEELTSMTGQTAVEHLLLGWEGLDEPYSPELAAEILTDEAYRAVRNSVYLAATRVGRHQVEFVKAAAKN